MENYLDKELEKVNSLSKQEKQKQFLELLEILNSLSHQKMNMQKSRINMLNDSEKILSNEIYISCLKAKLSILSNQISVTHT